MSSIIILRKLIEKLSKEEKKLCRKYLFGFSVRGENADNKSIDLFNILASVEQRELQESEIEFLLYGEKNFDAFVRLKLRLRNKILESLIVDVNIERDEAYSECSRILHTIRKKIIQAQIIKGRGFHDLAAMLFDEIIAQAKKYELYDELLLAVKYLIQIEAFNKRQSSIDKYLVIHKKYSLCRDALFTAQTNYHLLVGEGGLVGWKSKDLNQLKSAIDEIQIQYRKTSSATIAFYLFSLEIHFYQQTNQYPKAGRILKRLADVIESHIILFSLQRHAYALANIAWNKLYLRQFNLAITEANKSLKLLKRGSYSYYQSLEVLFYAEFYSGKYGKALKLIEQILLESKGEKAKFRESRREYLKACTLFMLGRNEEVNPFFLRYNQIEEDKEGWNVGLRILNVMNDIELGKMDVADFRIENIRKHLSKIKTSENVRPRQSLICDLLRELVHSSFNFKTVFGKMQSAINNLRSDDRRFTWEMLSPELIIFEEWFVSKTLGTQFNKQTIPKFIQQNETVSSINSISINNNG